MAPDSMTHVATLDLVTDAASIYQPQMNADSMPYRRSSAVDSSCGPTACPNVARAISNAGFKHTKMNKINIL
jgi:hypothetical protein